LTQQDLSLTQLADNLLRLETLHTHILPPFLGTEYYHNYWTSLRGGQVRYGGLIIANLFAYRSTNQSRLYAGDDPIGPENNFYLEKLSKEASMVVCAWSDSGGYKDRDQEVLKVLKNPHCLTKLKSGGPGHPLYKKRTLFPVPL